MKIGSWKIRGFGADNKKSMIKDIIRAERYSGLRSNGRKLRTRKVHGLR